MSHAPVHPGILGVGLGRRIGIAGAVIVLLWGALAWAVSPQAPPAPVHQTARAAAA